MKYEHQVLAALTLTLGGVASGCSNIEAKADLSVIDTTCFTLTAGCIGISGSAASNTATVSGLGVKLQPKTQPDGSAPPGCDAVKATSVSYRVFDDKNNNDTYDEGEKLFGSSLEGGEVPPDIEVGGGSAQINGGAKVMFEAKLGLSDGTQFKVDGKVPSPAG